MNKDSLNQFLQSQEVQAFKIARAAVGSHEDALDIVQDAMLKLCKYYADKPECEWPPLFYRILNNRIMDHFRKNKQLRNVVIEDVEANQASEVPDSYAPEGFRSLLGAQQLTRLTDALSALPARQQEAFLLRCWEGQSTASTADSMGCTEGSVKTHYSRALNALRQALQDLWP